jgi:hypothetical protein
MYCGRRGFGLNRFCCLGLAAFCLAAVSAPMMVKRAAFVGSGPVAWWPADGSPGDFIGGNAGRLSAGVDYAPGVVREGFRFNGRDGAVLVPDHEPLRIEGSLSISAWVRVERSGVPPGNGQIVFRGDDRGGLDPYWLGVHGGDTAVFQLASLTDKVELRAPVPPGRWIHLAATLDAEDGVMRVYTDAKVAAETKTDVRPFRDLDPSANPGVGIGNTQNPALYNQPFRGMIDEVRLYNRALPPEEVGRTYRAEAAIGGVGEEGTKRVSLRAHGIPLRSALGQLFDQVGFPVVVDQEIEASARADLREVHFRTALPALLNASSAGPLTFRIEEGVFRITRGESRPPGVIPPDPPPTAALNADRRFRFRGTMSQQVLMNYLSRAVTHLGLCASSPEESTAYLDDDLRMLTSIGARFIGRAAYAWVPPDDDDSHFRQAAQAANRFHRLDPDGILQACVFETTYTGVEKIPVPEWVFMEFGLSPERRNFRYEAMLYPGGKLRDHWVPGGSVPDMSRLETRMWFYYRSRRYIDAGFEAIHFGQVHLMDHNDPQHRHWSDLLERVRRYGRARARRGLVLCDAHTHGVEHEGKLLFDFHSYPLRIRETARVPQEARLSLGHADSIFRRSRGGQTPSGWYCASLPYLVEVDNYGVSTKPDEPGQGAGWIWGYDEITWFARQPEAYRNGWLRYAWDWARTKDPAGRLQFPTRRVFSPPLEGNGMYHANRNSEACPVGFSQENTIRTIWRQDARNLR